MRFRAEVTLGGKTATGIPVPDEVVTQLAAGKRPTVRVTIGGHSYRTTVAPMGGQFFVPLSAENREAAHVNAGDQVDVEIELDTQPRELALPSDLEAALWNDGQARGFFEELSYTHRKEWVRWLEDAKTQETRAARLERTLVALRERRRTH